MKTPEVVREQVASRARLPPSLRMQALPPRIRQRGTRRTRQNAAANPAAGGSQNGGLPPGHPTIELPTEARTFVDKIERDAIARPKDVVAWNKFGAVSMRAAMFDQTYYGKAEDAYGHVLKLDPDNLDALRGIGDIDYDKQHYDEAIAAYEHYLKKKPDDPEVRTDLGTMYLYTGNADQAVVQYKKAIASKPGFFQAYYNMGIAYAQDEQGRRRGGHAQAGDRARARRHCARSGQAADRETQRRAGGERVESGGVCGDGVGAEPAKQAAAAAKSPAAASSPAASVAMAKASPAAPASAEDDFHDAVEKMIRGLPIAGPKVTSVEWPDKLKAKVLMDNFPMDQMPPFAKTKFLTDLKAGIDSAKKDNNISSPVEVNIVDGASGKVMETITQ